MANRSRVRLNQSNASSRKYVNSETLDREYFWCVVLTAERRSSTWVVSSVLDDEFEHSLFLKVAILGGNAVSGEQNIVALHSTGEDGKTLKGTIANLTRGLNSMAPLEVTVPGRLGGTFVLIEGSGPITIAGNHSIEVIEDEINQTQTLISDEEESAEEMSSEEIKGKNKTGAKRKASRTGTKHKKGKMDTSKSHDDDDDDDDDDECEENDDDSSDDDDDYEDVRPKKAKKAKMTPRKTKGRIKSDKDLGKKAAKAIKK